MPHRILAVAVVALAVLASPANATTVENDPARPFSAASFAKVQRWIANSHVPTPARVRFHGGSCPDSFACANIAPCGTQWCLAPGEIWAAARPSQFTTMHEVGHVMDEMHYTTEFRARLSALLHTPVDGWWTSGFEVAADAYAMCAIHRRYPGRWWDVRGRNGVASGSPTPYDFRAGPRRYLRICNLIRSASTALGATPPQVS